MVILRVDQVALQHRTVCRKRCAISGRDISNAAKVVENRRAIDLRDDSRTTFEHWQFTLAPDAVDLSILRCAL